MVDAGTQLILYWAAVGFCFAGTVLFVSSFAFKRENYIRYGVICAYLAALPMTAALILRWLETGHVPSIGRYEVFTIYAGGSLLFYLLAQIFKPGLKIAGAVVLPAVILMTGVGVMSSTALTELPTTYFTYWLWIHMLFATLALGGILVSAGLSVLYLLKRRQEERGNVNALLAKLPPLDTIDYMEYRYALFAFAMIGIMIASGSIWAYRSWGRYWGWDPIETWSLISWLVYGLYLHLRIVGVKGKTSSWLGLLVIAIVVFSFFGAPYLYPTVHDRFAQ